LSVSLCVFSAASPCYHNSSSCCVFTKGTSSVLSITTHHHVVFTKGTSLRAINHNSSSCCFFERARPPCYQSQLIMLCFHEARPVLSITLIIMCVFTKGARPSVLSITTHHHVVFTKRHVPPASSQLIIMLCFQRRARPSVLSTQLARHHCVFTKGARPPASTITTHHHVSVFTKARPSVLSITTHHHVVFSRKGHVLRYQSQLIMLLFTKGTSSAINHNSSSCCVFTKGARPSVLSSPTHQ
jgi:hypothetical protein